MKQCVNCGAEIAEEEILCPVCGLASDEKAAEEEVLTEEAENTDTVEAEPEEPAEAVEAEPEEPAEAVEAEPEELIEAGSFADSENDTADDAAEDEETVDDSTFEEAAEPRKNRWSGLATAIVIVTVLVLLGLVGLVLWKEGTLQKWWNDIRPKTKSACTIEDYSEIQILKSAVEVDDETVNSYVLSMVGGELTDESAAAYAATIDDCDATTADELKEYAHDYIYKYYLHNEMMNYLKNNTTVKSYDELQEQELIAYATEELEYSASNYGMDANTVATYYGYESALDYATATAHEYQTIAMILDKVMKDKGLSYSDEDMRASIDTFLEENGYSAYYASTDEFLEVAGDTWLFLYENLTYKFDIVMEALEPNVVLIDEPAE